MLGSVDEISGAKRKQNLTEHADDARVSKQLATMIDDVEVPIEIAEELRSTPDRSKLRDAANEFELRAVIQRLDEEWDEVVPGAGRGDDRGRGAGGLLDDLADGRIAIAIAAGRWAATDGARWSPATPLDLAAFAELRGRPLIAHDAKALGGGAGPACSPPPPGASTSSTTRWSPPT